MPAQLSTIMYIADYNEKTSSDFFVGTAVGYTRLNECDGMQKFNITVFYPINKDEKPCYIPKLESNQVLSIANSKFSIAPNNELDIIITSGTVLDIPSDKLPVHQINVVGVAVASESACITNLGVQIECTITDYLSKDKPTEIRVILFHPTGSRFTNQTSTVKRGSSIFFSGTLTSIESRLYIELHNFSFIRGQSSFSSTSIKQNMPWLDSTKPSPSVSRSIAQEIHNKSQQTHESPKTSSPVRNFSHETPVTPFQSLSPPITPLKDQIIGVENSQQQKRKTRSTNIQQQPVPKRKTRSVNKSKKLSDIASDILTVDDPKSDSEGTQ